MLCKKHATICKNASLVGLLGQTKNRVRKLEDTEKGDTEKKRILSACLLVSSPACLTLHDSAEVEVAVAGEHIAERRVAKPLGHDLAQHIAEIGGDLEVARAVELLGLQPRPLAVDPAARNI